MNLTWCPTWAPSETMSLGAHDIVLVAIAVVTVGKVSGGAP